VEVRAMDDTLSSLFPARQPVTELLSLAGRCAVVTGAGRGIGHAVALRLAEAGAAVVITGRDTTALASTAQLVTARRPRRPDPAMTADLTNIVESR